MAKWQLNTAPWQVCSKHGTRIVSDKTIALVKEFAQQAKRETGRHYNSCLTHGFLVWLTTTADERARPFEWSDLDEDMYFRYMQDYSEAPRRYRGTLTAICKWGINAYPDEFCADVRNAITGHRKRMHEKRTIDLRNRNLQRSVTNSPSRNYKAQDLPRLPDSLTLTYGADQTVNIQNSLWQVRAFGDKGKVLSLNWLLYETCNSKGERLLSDRAVHIVMHFICDMLKTRKPHTAIAYFGSVKSFLPWIEEEYRGCLPYEWSYLDKTAFRSYLAWCNLKYKNGTEGANASTLRTFYKWGQQKKIRDFDKTLYQQIATVKIRGRERGKAVRGYDPYRGPLTEAEYQAILAALEKDNQNPESRALVMLFMQLGVRPASIINLVNKDLIKGNARGQTSYVLNIPLPKQSGDSLQHRPTPIGFSLGALLEEICQGGPDEPMIVSLRGLWSPEYKLTSLVQQWIKAQGIQSPRTEEDLHIFAYRFRRTHATNLINRGVGLVETARLLGHLSPDTIRFYMQEGPRFAAAIDEATKEVFEPLMQRFIGKTAEPTDPSIQMMPEIPLPPTSQRFASTAGIGRCGLGKPCEKNPSYSCYTCISFIAYRDAPHQEIVDEIRQDLASWENMTTPYLLSQLKDTIAAAEEIARIANQSQAEEDNAQPSAQPNHAHQQTHPSRPGIVSSPVE